MRLHRQAPQDYIGYAMSAAAALSRPLARVRVDRLPATSLAAVPSAVVKSAGVAAAFQGSHFHMRLLPLANLEPPPDTTRMPPALGPPWLPYPPDSSTHSPRHMRRLEASRLAMRLPRIMWAAGKDAPADLPLLLLRTTVFVSKKRVHKLAVARNRCRSRLLEVLRKLVADGGVPVVPRCVYIFNASAELYSAPQSEICSSLRLALERVALAQPAKPPRRSPRKP